MGFKQNAKNNNAKCHMLTIDLKLSNNNNNNNNNNKTLTKH